MIVAMRRSIRVGIRAGSPLEEFGVSPDVLHLMTRRDILEDNRDLMATRRTNHSAAAVVQAVGHAHEPQRRARNCRERRVEASVVEGGLGDLPGRYLRERSAGTFHRRAAGAVPSTQVTIGKAGGKAATVEVQACDHAGRLVAFRRTTLR